MDRDVAVVHHDLMSKGGGEAVAMTVLEALQDEYDLALITLKAPDFDELNRYYETEVEPMPVRIAGTVAPWLHDQFGIKYYILQNALLGRYARRHADEFDLLFSTINELGLDVDSMQYIHFPFDWTVQLPNRDDIFHPTVQEDGIYEWLCTHIAGVDGADIRSNTLLANSEWTADVVKGAYGSRPLVVYPPVDTEPFDPLPWDERERGFVTIGRIERSKRVVEMIQIVDAVRERGHDVHIHIIGPTVDETYYEEVAALATERPYVKLEGETSRERLVDLASSHRYGIHGKEHEHFGMAVAELAAGGCLTFVPASGGQPEVVGDHEELLYRSVNDAIEKVDRLLSRPGSPDDLRVDPEEVHERLGRERFKAEIRALVENSLVGTSGRATPAGQRAPATAESGGDD